MVNELQLARHKVSQLHRRWWRGKCEGQLRAEIVTNSALHYLSHLTLSRLLTVRSAQVQYNCNTRKNSCIAVVL